MSTLHLIATWSLAGILLLAARHKLADLAGFRTILGRYRLLPEGVVATAAVTVVAIELILGVSLLVPALRETAALGAAGLLSAYAAAIGINLARGRRRIDCGCGGEDTPISGWLVLRNVLLVTLAMTVPFAEPGAAPPTPWLAAAATALVWLAYASANQLLANAAYLRENLGVS